MVILNAVTKPGSLLILLILTCISVGYAQEEPLLLPGPKGVAIMAYQLFETPTTGDVVRRLPSSQQKVIIYKRAQGENDFRQIATLHFPASATEMQNRLGEKGVEILSRRFGTRDMGVAYDLIQKYSVDTLGLTLSLPPIQKAFGMLYIDSTWKKGDKVTYKFQRVNASGTNQTLGMELVDGSYFGYDLKFQLQHHSTLDSSSVASFVAKVQPGDNVPQHAVLYVRDEKTDQFSVVDTALINRKSLDSAVVSFSRTTLPKSHIVWYTRPMDIVGNVGLPSDTMFAISYQKEQVRTIENLAVTDTLNGLFLQWEKLPEVALYTSIQILKSRQMGRDYIVLDTIAASENTYLDRKVIPGTNYYYKVRPLLVSLPTIEPLLFRDAMGYKDFEEAVLPNAPQGLQAAVKEDVVELNWLSNPGLNLFGYYILRGTNLKNLRVIAGPIKEQQFIDTTLAKGFTGQYIYALQVMDNAQNMSDTSSGATVFVKQPASLFSPGGIQARRTDDGVSLNWENTRTKDNSIVGYMIYRRLKEKTEYELLNQQPVPLPSFVDSSAFPLKQYEYVVSSIDQWGNQSVLSPLATIEADVKGVLRSPALVSLRSTSKGIELAWPEPLDIQNKAFVIYRKTMGGDFEQIAVTKPSAGKYLDQKAEVGTLYQYALSVRIDDIEGAKGESFMIRRK